MEARARWRKRPGGAHAVTRARETTQSLLLLRNGAQLLTFILDTCPCATRVKLIACATADGTQLSKA